MVTGFSEDTSGVLWVTTFGGLNRFNSAAGTFTHYSHDPDNPQSLCSDRLASVFADSKGTVWIGSLGHGLDRLDPANGRIRHYVHEPHNSNSLANDFVLSLLEDSSGKLWIGMSGGYLDEFDEGSGEFVHFSWDRRDSTSLEGNFVSAIHQDRLGTIWVGTRGGGLHRLDRVSGKFSHIRMNPRNAGGLSSNSVHSIYEDGKGTLWIATSAGLDMLPRPAGTIRHFTTKDGISNDYIGGILEDNGGSLWLRTNLGLSKFNPATGKIRNYGVSDGVSIMQGWDQSYYKDKHGEMYFGGTNGFLRFHPDSIKDNPFVPPIVITAFRIFDKLVSLDSAISEKHSLEISYKENVFSLEFAALNYSSSEKNQYAYSLEGFDNDWIYCGTRRYATYTNLDGGTYVFRVKGSNNDGVWNEYGKSITIIITPPFWATWWFRAVGFVALLLSVGGSIRYVEMKRLKRKIEELEHERALERERTRISQDMHDEVGSSLSEIAILSELAKKKPDESQAHIQEISDLASELIDNVSEIVWAINPRNGTLDNLIAHTRRYSVKYLSLSQIRCTFIAPENVPPHRLTAELRRNLFLVVKEALHNIVKHARAREVSLMVELVDGSLEIQIEDNGRGFIVAEAGESGNGLGNMTKRMADIGGVLTLTSEPGHGTRVAMRVRVVSRQ